MNFKTLLAAAVIAGILPTTVALAQPPKLTVLEGTIQSPYKDEDGTIVVTGADKARTKVVLAPMYFLAGRGATADMFKAGTKVKVEGNPTENKGELKAYKITLNDNMSFLMSNY